MQTVKKPVPVILIGSIP